MIHDQVARTGPQAANAPTGTSTTPATANSANAKRSPPYTSAKGLDTSTRTLIETPATIASTNPTPPVLSAAAPATSRNPTTPAASTAEVTEGTSTPSTDDGPEKTVARESNTD